MIINTGLSYKNDLPTYVTDEDFWYYLKDYFEGKSIIETIDLWDAIEEYIAEA